MTPVPFRELCYFHPKHVSCGSFHQTTYIWLIHGCIINRINSSWGIKLPVIKPLIECSDLGNWFYCPLIQTKIFGEGVRFSECCRPRERERFVLQSLIRNTFNVSAVMSMELSLNNFMFQHSKYNPATFPGWVIVKKTTAIECLSVCLNIFLQVRSWFGSNGRFY